MKSPIFQISFLCLLSFLLLFSNCKPKPIEPTEPTTQTVTIDAGLRDAYELAQQFYLWNKNLPSINDFDFNTYNTVPLLYFEGIRRFSEGKDKFSFALTSEQWNAATSGDSRAFGIRLSLLDNDYYINFVDNNSPAHAAGLKRGMKLVFDSQAQQDRTIENINNGVDGTIFKVQASSTETPVAVTYIRQDYKSTNVLTYDILSSASHSVAYIHLSSFIIDDFDKEIDTVFADIKTNNVSKLILDLRYNGGGRTDFMEYIANHLVCDDFDKQVMYKFIFNDDNTAVNQTINFEKNNNASCMDEIYFIISENSASASEILINILKPFISNIKLIGSAPTAGKFIGQSLFDESIKNFVLAPITFRTVNAEQTQTLFEGFAPEFMVADDPRNDWGINEASIKSALSLIDNPSLAIDVMQEGDNKAILLNFSSPKLFIKTPSK